MSALTSMALDPDRITTVRLPSGKIMKMTARKAEAVKERVAQLKARGGILLAEMREARLGPRGHRNGTQSWVGSNYSKRPKHDRVSERGSLRKQEIDRKWEEVRRGGAQ